MTECGCPGSRMMDMRKDDNEKIVENGARQSQLRQWPVQLHLVGHMAPYFYQADILLAADCVAYALADFHKDYLSGRGLSIACPKLDTNMEIYSQKITALVDKAKINTLTVMIMEVPCCSGLFQLAKQAVGAAERTIPIRTITVGIDGTIREDTQV